MKPADNFWYKSKDKTGMVSVEGLDDGFINKFQDFYL